MLLKIICSIFVLNIYVLKCACECAVGDKKVPYSTVKYANETEIRFEIKDICSKVEQLQLIEIRSQQNQLMGKVNESTMEQNSQRDLLNQLMGKVNESTMEQNSQKDLLKNVLGMLNELSEKFNKVTNLERNIDIYKAEQIRQGKFLEELMSKIKESTTELISQRTLLNEIVDKVNGSTTDQIRQCDLLNRLTSLDPIQIPSSCAEVPAVGCSSGIHQILVPSYSKLPFFVSCDMMTQGGGWTTVLRREDGSVDFFRFWNDYKTGFGSLTGEFFIGLDKLHYMTKAGNQELLITMEDAKGQQKSAKYDQFRIASENEAYKLITLGKYSGDAGNDLRFHVNYKFSARDRDNDNFAQNCADIYKSGWWYHACHNTNLMGKYNEIKYGQGINWMTFTGFNSSLKRVQMMIRPRSK